jgi:hypothetical protein
LLRQRCSDVALTGGSPKFRGLLITDGSGD